MYGYNFFKNTTLIVCNPMAVNLILSKRELRSYWCLIGQSISKLLIKLLKTYMLYRIYFIYDVAKTRVKLDNIKVPFLLYHNGNRETVPLYPFMIASIWMNRNKHHELYDLMVIHQDEIINMQYEVEERADKTDERLREMDREMNRKIDDVVARVNEVDTALNIRMNVLEYDLNMRLNKIEERVSALEAEVQRMNVTLSALSDGMEELLKKSRAPIR